MFCRNVDSFPSRQISGTRYFVSLAKVMPEFFMNFSMTCATMSGISSAFDLPEWEFNDISAKHRAFFLCHCSIYGTG